jgi:hypothetical protein
MEQMLAKVKSKYWVCTHYGIKIPKTVQEAKATIGAQKNGNTFWWDDICQELKNVRPAFKVWHMTIGELPLGYQCRLIFDVKMGENNFRRKARFVAGGHATEV